MSFNPFDAEVMACPYPHMAQARREAPVAWSAEAGAFVVTSHHHVMEVLRRPLVFSSRFGRAGRPVPAGWREQLDAVIAEGYPRSEVLLTTDPPAHTRYRRLVARSFTPAAVARFEPAVRAIVTELIDGWAESLASTGRVEFMAQFANPVPVRAVANALNVPDRDMKKFKEWSDLTASAIGTDISLDGLLRSERAINEFQRYFEAELDRRRTEPQDDLLTHILTATIEEDDPEVTDRRPLDMAEMLRILQMILVAGNETTAALLGDLMRLLGERPDEWARLQREPERIPVVIEEALRHASPNGAIWRVAATDTELGGVAIPAGSRVIITYMSANRDEAVFGPDAEEFRPDREHVNEHIAFGFGNHYCLGAPLSRMETRVALEELTRRVQSFRLSDDNDGAYAPSYFLRVPTRVTIEPVMA